MTPDAERAVDVARAFAITWNKGWVETAVVVESETVDGRSMWMVGVFEPDPEFNGNTEEYWGYVGLNKIPVDIAYYVDPQRPSHVGYSYGRGITWAPVTGPIEWRGHTDPSEL